MIIKNITYYFSLIALILLASCSSSPEGLGKMAMKRLPDALEKAMEDQMSVKGGARIQSPEIIFDCDSIGDLSADDCIFQNERVKVHASAVKSSRQARHARADNHNVFVNSFFHLQNTSAENISFTTRIFLPRKIFKDIDRTGINC